MEENVAKLPMSIIAACDTKINNYCKIIDPKAEIDLLLVLSMINKAATMSDSVCVADGKLFIQNKAPCPPEIIDSLAQSSSASAGDLSIDIVRIPCSIEQDVIPSCLCVSSDYYLDGIAAQLNLSGCQELLVSKAIGKSSSETRLYFPAPADAESSYSESSENDLSRATRLCDLEHLVNKRASCLAGQTIYGDAILANVGYKWKSSELHRENVTLSTYHRLVLGKWPAGIYKLSREAVLAAELPSTYAKHSWRGLPPRAILSGFCHQHGLLEPEYILSCASPSKGLKESTEVCKKQKTDDGKEDKDRLHKCDTRISSCKLGPLVEYFAVDTYANESNAIQHSSLKLLTWFSDYFKHSETPVEEFCSSDVQGIKVYPQNFAEQFASFFAVVQAKKFGCSTELNPLESFLADQPKKTPENGMIMSDIIGADSGVYPSAGSIACVSYTASLIMKDSCQRYVLESSEEFEFEVGASAVLSQLECCATLLSVDQSTKFVMELPPRDLVLAAAGESANAIFKSALCEGTDGVLEFAVKLVRVTEPLEDRMEKALFSPSLSKQRVDFAVKHINDSNATTLVDFGCGSGSLLDALLGHRTTLRKIVGVDISHKGLTRAAKCIHQKLSENTELQKSISSAVLYEGFITDYDSRIFGFDMATCLEVIEHMEEDQARLFGCVVLEEFRPGILILSTPNYEYNPILRRSSLPNPEDDPDEKLGACNYRNLDHKFEWTRQQFQCWAGDLASRYNYSVEFSGVGGSGDMEPGFASQIAVFRRNQLEGADVKPVRAAAGDPTHPYELLWEWAGE